MINKNIKNKKFSQAFTLAEVLITLGIIGAVAAVTIPTLITGVSEQVRMHSAKAFTKKITDAIELMNQLETLAPYDTTDDFVKELNKYLSITKVCDSSHITDCWPTDTVHLYDGTAYSISEATNGESAFQMGTKDINGNDADYSGNTVTIVIVDGTTALISYNTKCSSDDKRATENCFAAAFDINGNSQPNKIGQDIILLNATRFGNSSSPSQNDIECTGKICNFNNNLPILPQTPIAYFPVEQLF